MTRCGNPRSRDGLGRLPFSSFALLKAFLQGLAKAHEGGGRDAEVRSLRCGVGVCIGPSATQSSTESQTEWPKWPGMGLPGSSHAWGPTSFPDAHNPRARTPFPADGGGGLKRPRLVRPQLSAANSCAAVACSRGNYCSLPGLWPSLSRWESVRLAREVLGSKVLQPRSQMQFTGKLLGQCRTLVLHFELVSGLQKGGDFI